MHRPPLLAPLVLFAVGFSASSCATAAKTTEVPKLESASGTAMAPPRALGGAEKHVLHLHGSNTLGRSVVPRLARAFLEKEGAREVFINDESRAKERIWVQARVGEREISIEIYSPGTKVGFESLERGWCDLVLASRPINGDEAKRLEGTLDLGAPSSEHVVAMDGIAVVVHPSNPVSRLTLKQLEQVFSGQVTSWDKVGGKAGPIHVFTRDDKSGTHDAFVALAMRGKQPRTDHAFEDSEALSQAVAKDEHAIGFVGMAYVKLTKAIAVQEGAARAIAPTPFTVATEDYPLARRLFFYTPHTAKDPLISELVEFALSDEGQVIVGAAGLVPLSLRAEAAQVPTDAPPEYAKLASGATRLSATLRFKPKSATLDAKALRDIDRLVRHLASPINRGRKVSLAGFSDGGTEEGNDKIAHQRVESVASLLAKRGLTPADVASFGSALPLASNDAPEGRARNRRVEVWLH